MNSCWLKKVGDRLLNFLLPRFTPQISGCLGWRIQFPLRGQLSKMTLFLSMLSNRFLQWMYFKLDSFWSTSCNLCTQTYFSKGVKVRITLITDIGSTHKTFQHQHVFVTNRERGLKVSKVVTNSICQQLFLWARTFWGQGNVLVLSLERTQRRQIKEGSTHYARSETNKRLKWNLMTLAECSI